MGKTMQEQLEIMKHYADGGLVEIYKDGEWSDVTNKDFKNWNFAFFDFRIKEEKKTIIIEKWLVFIEEDNEYKIMETSNINSYNQSIYKQIKLLETYEVEL